MSQPSPRREIESVSVSESLPVSVGAVGISNWLGSSCLQNGSFKHSDPHRSTPRLPQRFCLKEPPEHRPRRTSFHKPPSSIIRTPAAFAESVSASSIERERPLKMIDTLMI